MEIRRGLFGHVLTVQKQPNCIHDATAVKNFVGKGGDSKPAGILFPLFYRPWNSRL